MKVKLMSRLVFDQAKTLRFYGEYRWLTVVSPPDDVELLLEPHPAAGPLQQDAVDDVQ
jgi:hypothetical protein